MFYHVGGNQHIQNIQINKVTGEKEKCVFYFMNKTNGLFGQPKTLAFYLRRNKMLREVYISKWIKI